MRPEDAVSMLRRLLEICRDSTQGYKTAAEAVRDPALERLFLTYGRQRREFAAELEAEIRRLGGTPPRGGSVLGALHRAVINFRAAVANPDELAILLEATRGEDAARAAYEKALASPDLPAEVRTVIERQAWRVREAGERLRDLERAA